MNNWKILTVIALFVTASTFAQSNLLNAKTPDQIGKKSDAQLNSDNDKPLPYGYILDRDLLMGKRVWEIIDLDEKVNFPFYFPVEGDLGPDRQPLYKVLMDAIRDGKLTEIYDSSYFTKKLTMKEIEQSIKMVDTADAGREQYNAGEKISDEYIIPYTIEPYHVTAYKTVGYWYFDKRQGDMRYRILGLCPMVPDVYTLNKEEKDYIELFWIYYPAARDILHSSRAFNDRNSATPFTFDQLFNARRFNGVVEKEENVYGDRAIKEYMKENSQMQLLEAERIKEKLRNFEQDMWNY